MKIAIDVREACRKKKTGKGQWTYGFVTELLSRGRDVVLITDSPLPEAWQGVPSRSPGKTGLGWHLAVASRLRDRHFDLYLSTTSYIVPWIVGRKVPYAQIVHDLIAFRGEPHDAKATFVERLTLGRAVRGARHVFT